ncbi:MAG: hypothetical protein C0608_11635 [Deltaproteobacteria bacterium]|nr:MAG: hypothetical protein C0608_11635 [Deltaproteobacteria bacterium]
MDKLIPVERAIKVEDAWNGLSLLEAVRIALPALSSREIFKKVRMGELNVNGSRRSPMDLIYTGDIIKVTLSVPPPPVKVPVLRENVYVKTPAGPFTVVREDEELLIVTKPPGCASHPALRHSGDTLIERVRFYLEVSEEDEFQPALANRLDIETSGIVLVGKSVKARQKLGIALQKGLVGKRYIALVAGRLEAGEGEILKPLEKRVDSRDIAKYPAGHPRLTGRVQEAHTRYRVLAQSQYPLPVTLVEVELLTGRNHQIRRHFADLGYPVVMDNRYGDRNFNGEIDELTALGRMFLHAWRVTLDHPKSREPLKVISPLPTALEDALKIFGLNGSKSIDEAGDWRWGEGG